MGIVIKVPWRARPNFRFDAAAGAFGGFYSGAIFPFVAFVARRDLNADAAQLGLLTAAPYVGNLIALPFAQMISRGRPVTNYSRLLVFARLIMVYSSFASGSISFVWTVFAVQCLAAIPSPTYAAVIRSIYPTEHRGRLLSYARTSMAAGMMVSTFVAGWMFEFVSWRWLFLAAAPFGMIASYLFSRLRLPSDHPSPDDRHVVHFVWGAFKLLKEDVAFRWFALSVSVFGFGNLLTIPVYTMYQVDTLHITAGWLAIITNTAQITWMMTYAFWGRFIDHVNPLQIVMINTFLAALIPINYIFASQAWMLFPMAVVQGVISSGIDLSYFNSVMRFSTHTNAEQYQGMHSLLVGLRGVIAPFVGAEMAQSLKSHGGDIRWVFAVGAMMVILGAALQWVGLKHAPRESGI